jgi:hypothetical protein
MSTLVPKSLPMPKMVPKSTFKSQLFPLSELLSLFQLTEPLGDSKEKEDEGDPLEKEASNSKG